jgi:hypothetical protein
MTILIEVKRRIIVIDSDLMPIQAQDEYFL